MSLVISYPTTDTATSGSTPTSNSNNGFSGGNVGGGTTSLYLFTFLITIVVLGSIAGALLVRAYIVRRRFQRRIEEALREGRALPPDMAIALGLMRPGNRNNKKEKKVGKMPLMWEAEMDRDEKKALEEMTDDGHVLNQDEWDEITPLAMLHFPPDEPPPPPKPIDLPQRPRLTGRSLVRAIFRPDNQTPMEQLREAALNRQLTRGTILVNEPALEVPPEGTDVVMGVMIAMPNEHGHESQWYSSAKEGEDEEEEKHLPFVCLGVMPATIKA